MEKSLEATVKAVGNHFQASGCPEFTYVASCQSLLATRQPTKLKANNITNATKLTNATKAKQPKSQSQWRRRRKRRPTNRSPASPKSSWKPQTKPKSRRQKSSFNFQSKSIHPSIHPPQTPSLTHSHPLTAHSLTHSSLHLGFRGFRISHSSIQLFNVLCFRIVPF